MSLSRVSGRNLRNETVLQLCYFDDQLLLDTNTAYRAAQIMKTEADNIIRKQKKPTSKALSGCKEKYQNSFRDLQNAIEEISSALELPKERGRSEFRRSVFGGMSERRFQTDECLSCISKDRKLESIKKELKHSETNTLLALTSQDKLEAEFRSMNISTIDNQNEEIRRLEIQTSKLKQQLQTEKDMKDDALKSIMLAVASRDKLEEEMRGLKTSEDNFKEEIRRLKEQTVVLKQQLQTEKDMKDADLRRQKEMTSSQLKDKKPSELSFQNRPTKIAEKLSDLYDNQWSDAFDALQQDGKQDQTIVKELLGLLIDVFNECSRLANEGFFKRVQDSIEFPVERQGCGRPVELPDKLKQQVKEFRNVRAAEVMRDIQEVVLQNLGHVNKPNDIKGYLALCVEIGWLSAVQDPPLALLDKTTGKFDTDTFKEYTQRGPFVAFIVWPALLLHENGPLLAKGVAQGCSVKP